MIYGLPFRLGIQRGNCFGLRFDLRLCFYLGPARGVIFARRATKDAADAERRRGADTVQAAEFADGRAIHAGNLAERVARFDAMVNLTLWNT